eukprot:gene36732-41579_t
MSAATTSACSAATTSDGLAGLRRDAQARAGGHQQHGAAQAGEGHLQAGGVGNEANQRGAGQDAGVADSGDGAHGQAGRYVVLVARCREQDGHDVGCAQADQHEAQQRHGGRRRRTNSGAILTSEHKKSSLVALTLAAVGIVYGDIGTSPLYTLKTIFDPAHGLALTQANLVGIVSLIFWGLTVIVSLKYVTLVLRADNRGEGGIMALMALALNSVSRASRWHVPLML